MPSYKTILVAIKDLDARSMPAVRKAAQLAKSQGATLELFHALSETILVDALEATRISLKDFEAERLAATLKRLEVLAKRIRKHDIEVTCAAEWDYPPAEAIVRRAMRIKADLIVAERHATRHMACGVALGDDEVCLDAHRASHDRFGRGVVPLGSAGDFDVVFANALSEHLEALQRGSKSFCFEVL